MIHINIGSNLDSDYGSKFDNITIAIDLLIMEKLKVKNISNFYETPSYPNRKLPKFLNIGIKAEYNGNYQMLIKKIKLIEKKIGRIKTKKNDPRVIDIDIIDFNKKKLKGKINLPHSRMHKRNFVLFPLFEIDKTWKHPVSKHSIKKLLLSLKNRDIRSIKQI